MSEKIEETCIIPSRLKELRTVDRFISKIAKQASLNEDERDNLAIAVTEVVGNAIIHGNKRNPEKQVYITFKILKNRADIIVRDEGEGFDPDQLDDPIKPDNLMREHGRGIFILKALMDKVDYSFDSKGTKVHLSMKIKA